MSSVDLKMRSPEIDVLAQLRLVALVENIALPEQLVRQRELPDVVNERGGLYLKRAGSLDPHLLGECQGKRRDRARVVPRRRIASVDRGGERADGRCVRFLACALEPLFGPLRYREFGAVGEDGSSLHDLGRLQGREGVGHHGIRVSRHDARRDTRGHGDRQIAAPHVLPDLSHQRSGKVERRLRGGAGADDGELVAARSVEAAVAAPLADIVRDAPKHAVSGRPAEQVVDPVEVVDVERNQCHVPTPSARLGDVAAQVADKH